MTLALLTAEGLEPLTPAEAGDRLTAVLGSDDVALHRVQLSATTPRERLAEARMRAVDLAARPVEELHVALGPPLPDGSAWIAIIAAERMEAWTALVEAAGRPVDGLVPAALLLDAPGEGATMARIGEQVLLRTADAGGLVEPEIARLMLGTAIAPRPASLLPFAPAARPDPLPLDLRQGAFAPRLRWWTLGWVRIWAAILAALALLLALAPFAIDAARTRAAIAAHDEAVLQLAETTLGQRPASPSEAQQALAQARREAEGGALGARLSHAAATLEGVPGARLAAVRLSPDGRLVLTLAGPADAVNAARGALVVGPFEAEGEGTGVTLGDRRAPLGGATPLNEAQARFVAARMDAALIAGLRQRPPPPDRATIEAALRAAGLVDASVTDAPTGPRIRVEAARATVLLPLLADLETRGMIVSAALLSANADATLAATVETRR